MNTKIKDRAADILFVYDRIYTKFDPITNIFDNLSIELDDIEYQYFSLDNAHNAKKEFFTGIVVNIKKTHNEQNTNA